jgi:hypothetical protein
MARVVLLVIAIALGAQPARAQSNPTYVQFENAAAKGVLYRPDSEGEPPTDGLILADASLGNFTYLRD